MKVTEQALLIYSFAPIIPGDAERDGWKYLERQWAACAALGMTERDPDMRVPASFPEAPSESGSLRLLAFVRHPSRTKLYSAFLFAEYDVAGLVVAIAPDGSEPGMRSWADILKAWQQKVGNATPVKFLGEFIVLTGLGHFGRPVFGWRAGAIDRAVRAACEEAVGHPWQSVVMTSFGVRVYGFAQPDPLACSSIYCLVGDSSAKTVLDGWAWAREGRSGLAPFTRLCLHAAKLDYQAEVRDSATPVSAATQRIDDEVAAILQVASLWPPREAVRTRDLMVADGRLQLLLQEMRGADWGISRRRDMRATVDSELRNLRRYLPEIVSRAGDPLDPFMQILDPFTEISEKAVALRRQLELDIDYLDGMLERAHAAHESVRLIVEQASQQRSERITILQTSVISALVTALTAVQALGFHVPLADRLHAPVIAFLTVLAFALPVALARWVGIVPASVPYRWPDHIAAALLGAAFGWMGTAVIWDLSWKSNPPWFADAGSAVGCAVLLGASITLLDRHRNQPLRNAAPGQILIERWTGRAACRED